VAERLINLLNTELNPICHLLILIEAHHVLHVSRIRVKVPVHVMKTGAVVGVRLHLFLTLVIVVSGRPHAPGAVCGIGRRAGPKLGT
jgi:hypothetical protein